MECGKEYYSEKEVQIYMDAVLNNRAPYNDNVKNTKDILDDNSLTPYEKINKINSMFCHADVELNGSNIAGYGTQDSFDRYKEKYNLFRGDSL